MPTRLVSDVGGTNVRFALFDEVTGLVRDVSSLPCREFPHFSDAVEAYLASLEGEKPQSACFAIAALQTLERIQMTNTNWSFSRGEIAEKFGFRQFGVVNDFAAVALALPQLKTSQLHSLTPDLPAETHNLLAFGPGTGLGGAHWHSAEQVTACEPGHAGLSPATALELEVFKYLQPRWGEIYAELLVSGPGLLRLYQTLATIRDERPLVLTAEEISARALQGTDSLCVSSLELFCALLGSAAGDFAISAGAYGGVFLAGGIVAHVSGFLEKSDFLKRFINKGAMAEHLQKVPVNIITYPYPGLLGAGLWPLETQSASGSS